MLRKIILFFAMILFYILQCTLFNKLALASVSPNLLLILVFAAGFMRGRREGMYVGFFCGMLIDLFYGKTIGFNALVYMYIGYCNGFFNNVFYDDDVTFPIGLMFASDFVYNFVFYVFAFLVRNRLAFTYYFTNIILPEMIYTVVIMLLIYRPMLKINRKLEEIEKRSAAKFG